MVFRVSPRIGTAAARLQKETFVLSSGAMPRLIWVIKDKSKWFIGRSTHEATRLEIFHSFAPTLLEIAFIIETMIESSKSGKSIGCSVAINNRLETSRHWWNPRPFFCGGLSAVAVHVNNAWSQIDSSSLSSPSTLTAWLTGWGATFPQQWLAVPRGQWRRWEITCPI